MGLRGDGRRAIAIAVMAAVFLVVAIAAAEGGDDGAVAAAPYTVRWHGYIRDACGYGDEARNFILGLDALNVTVAATPLFDEVRACVCVCAREDLVVGLASCVDDGLEWRVIPVSHACQSRLFIYLFIFFLHAGQPGAAPGGRPRASGQPGGAAEDAAVDLAVPRPGHLGLPHLPAAL